MDTLATHPDADVIYGDYAVFGEQQGRWRYPESFTPDEL